MSGKLETTVMQSQVSEGSKRGLGSGEEEEEKVGVGSERNKGAFWASVTSTVHSSRSSLTLHDL